MIKELSKLDNELILDLENSFNIKNDFGANPFSHYLIFINDDKIFGYLNYYLMYDRIEIANFSVLERYQNNHIGTKLLTSLIDTYYGKVKNITLEVKKDNSKAIYLYKKIGFIEKSIRKGYYNGIDGILMEREMM